MTNQNPDEIRADIDRTRYELSRDVNDLEDAAAPGNVARRQINKLSRRALGVKGRVSGSAGSLRETIMGSAHDARYSMASSADDVRLSLSARSQDARERVSNAAGEISERTGEVVGAARRQAEGSPLTAGLVALSVGWLIGSLLPASSAEQRAAVAVKERAQPLLGEAKEVAQEALADLREPAQRAAEAVAGSARSAAEDVTAEGRRAAGEVRASAVESGHTIADGYREQHDQS